MDNTWSKDEVPSKRHIKGLHFFPRVSVLARFPHFIRADTTKFVIVFYDLFHKFICPDGLRSLRKPQGGFDLTITVTSCPFILPSHYLIDSSQAATASHY